MISAKGIEQKVGKLTGIQYVDNVGVLCPIQSERFPTQDKDTRA